MDWKGIYESEKNCIFLAWATPASVGGVARVPPGRGAFINIGLAYINTLSVALMPYYTRRLGASPRATRGAKLHIETFQTQYSSSLLPPPSSPYPQFHKASLSLMTPLRT